MRYATVCSGINAVRVACDRLTGWQEAFSSEIDPFCNDVLAHHWPETPNLGDLTRYEEWPEFQFDVLFGGTPCQDLSVAGRRAGLDGERSKLFYSFAGVAERYRPSWLVFENVPGLLSSNDGRDFGTVLGTLAELGYGVAYAVRDAQFFGVPQRRRRVFVIGYLGDWRPPAAVLFERHSLSGNPPPSRGEGKSVAGTFSGMPQGGGFGTDFECAGGLQVAHPLRAQHNASLRCDSDTYVTHTLRGEGFDASEDGTGRGTPIIAAPLVARQAKGGFTDPVNDNIIAFNGRMDPVHGEIAGTLDAGHPQSQSVYDEQSVVRRLTPRECERLQGFPDDFTLIPYKRRRRLSPMELYESVAYLMAAGYSESEAAILAFSPDGPRYKALGNSMAVPCIEWLARRIQLVEDTMRRLACE